MALAPPGCSQQPGKYKVPFGITTDDTLVSHKEGHRKQGPRAPRTKSFGEMIHHNVKFQVRKFQYPVQNPKGTISPYMDVHDARTGRTGRTWRLFCTGLYRTGIFELKICPTKSSSSVLPYPQRPLPWGCVFHVNSAFAFGITGDTGVSPAIPAVNTQKL